jgi:hypothetical protein
MPVAHVTCHLSAAKNLTNNSLAAWIRSASISIVRSKELIEADDDHEDVTRLTSRGKLLVDIYKRAGPLGAEASMLAPGASTFERCSVTLSDLPCHLTASGAGGVPRFLDNCRGRAAPRG